MLSVLLDFKCVCVLSGFWKQVVAGLTSSVAKCWICSDLSAAEKNGVLLQIHCLGCLDLIFSLHWTYDFWVLFRNAKWVLNYKGVYWHIFMNNLHWVYGNLYMLWLRGEHQLHNRGSSITEVIEFCLVILKTKHFLLLS